MVDQSHNEKPKIDATIQTVVMAQELFAKAAIVDHDALRRAEHRRSGYARKAAADRRVRRKALGIVQGSSYA